VASNKPRPDGRKAAMTRPDETYPFILHRQRRTRNELWRLSIRSSTSPLQSLGRAFHAVSRRRASVPAPQPQPTPDAAPENRQPAFTWSHFTGSGRLEIAVWDKVV